MLTNSRVWQIGAISVLCSWVSFAEETSEFERVGKLNAIAVSADGKLVLTAAGKLEEGAEGQTAQDPISLAVWDVANKRALCRPEGHKGEVCSVAISPDGKRAASGSADGSIFLWYTSSWQKAGVLAAGNTRIRCLAFNPASNWLAAGTEDGAVTSWDIHTKGKVFAIPAAEPGKAVRALAYKPQKNTLALGGDDKLIRVWDATERKELARLTGHLGSIVDLSFSLNGELLLAADTEGKVLLWNVNDRKVVQEFDAGAGTATRAAFSPDCRQVLTSGPNNALKLWDSATGKLQNEGIALKGALTAVRYSPDGQSVIVGIEDRVVLLPSSLCVATKKAEDEQQNRMVVWGPCSKDKLRGEWGIMVYKSVKKPNPWVVKWMGTKAAVEVIRVTVTGNVELTKEFRKDEKEGNKPAADKEKLEKQKITKRRGQIVAEARLEDHWGGFSFDDGNSMFKMGVVVDAGKQRELTVEEARIYIGRDGVQPRSNPFTLYRETKLPADNLLKTMEKEEEKDERR